jgi:ribosomal protein L28
MKDPAETTKASSKKRKKEAHDSEPQLDGWIAVHKKATREYLAQLSTHTVISEALKTEIRLALNAFALREAEWEKHVVIPTPHFAELPVCPRYQGEGEPLPHGDPPIPVTGCLPRPLGGLAPQMAE